MPNEIQTSAFLRLRAARHLSEGLIGEIVTIITKAAIAAIRSGTERISEASIDELRHVPVSKRRNSALRESLL